MHSIFRRAVCSLVTFTFAFSTTASNYALAAGAAQYASGAARSGSSIEDLGKTGNAYGKELGGQIKNGGGPTFDGTNINFSAGGTNYSISKDKLAPSDNGDNIRYAHTAEDYENQKSLYNDGGQMDEKGTEQKDALFADASSDNPTIEGEVYALLVDMAKKDKPDYSGEVFWEKTTEIMGDMENVLKDLVTCDAESALDTQYTYKHIEDLKQCQQVVDRSMTCTIKHDYTAGIIEHADGPFNIKSCGTGCTELWIGQVGDNYWGGSCAIYEQWTKVRVHNPEAILSATFDYAKWDDYMMVYVGKPGQEQLVWTGPFDWRTYPNYFPPETPGKCELSTSWQTTPDGPIANCSAPSRCMYGGMLKGGTSEECDCNPRPDCNDEDVCPYGGVPKKDGTQACSCRPAPDCSEQCVYGGSPLRDGTQECKCSPNPNPKPGEDPWKDITLPWTDVPPDEPPDPTEDSAEAPDYEQTPGVDVTQFFRSAQDGDIINFKIRVSVTGGGEGYGRIHVRYDPSKIVSNDLWKPKDCVDAASGIEDGFAKGEIKCSNMPSIDSSGCAWINGVNVCPEHLADSPLSSVSKFCRQVEVQTDYNFYKGDTGCWQAMAGFDDSGNVIYEEVCGGENLGGNLDTCSKYKDDPACKFVESTCTPGMTGASGTCYVNDVTYDCGTDVKVDEVKADTTYDCKGIACLGESCIDVERTYSTDFTKINALLNAAQYMAEDMECTGLDENGNPIGDQNVDCTVFGGESGYCKIAVGGWQDCCEPIGGPGVGEYISMIISAQKSHSATISMADQAVEKFMYAISKDGTIYNASLAEEMAGQYKEAVGAVKNVLRNGVDYLSNFFGSTADNVYTYIDYLTAPFDWFKEQVIDQLTKYAKDMLTSILKSVNIDIGGAAGGGGVETDMFQETLNKAFGTEVGGALGSAITIVGWVYLAYQIANIVIQLVYKCEQEEYEMLSKKEAKNCHYVGSYCKSKKLGLCIVKHRVYCCFQSPLSRIINEQIKATQGEILGEMGDWGSPENPKCNGIPLDKIDEIDWDKIDLDEWTALLVSTGNMTTADEIDLEKLTGAASNMNWTAKRGTVEDWNPPVINGDLEFNKDDTANTLPNESASAASASVMAASVSEEAPQAAAFSMRRAAAKEETKKKPNDRLNTIERAEARLNGMEVDGLRIESARCITLVLGDGVTVRGGCGEETNAELYCRKNGALVDCEDIAYQNSLGELLGNKPDSKDYWDAGYRCIKHETSIDCSTLYSKDSYIRALEEYARIIGGTTYLNRYVCLDKSGTYTKAICEHAMEQNYCSCLDGNFICQDGNKQIACAALGGTKNDCECMLGACDESCPYGGTPTSQLDNEVLVCTSGNCPYGFTRNGVTSCSSAICPYGH